MWVLIGYGNELRQDDGVGPVVARVVAGWELPQVKALAVPQLTPELAEEVASAEAAVFVDAALGAESAGVTVRELEPEASTSGVDHAVGPTWLLSLAQAVYGKRPPAWLVTIPAWETGFGGQLSLPAEWGTADALRLIRRCFEAREGACTKWA